MEFTVNVKDEALRAKFAGLRANLRKALILTITKLSIDIQRSVKEDKLTGQVLHVRTGTGRRSINREVNTPEHGVFATIGTNVNYMIGWEKGFDRKIGAGSRGGQYSSLSELARQRLFERKPISTVHIDARPYLRPTLDEFRDRIREDIREAVLGVLR